MYSVVYCRLIPCIYCVLGRLVKKEQTASHYGGSPPAATGFPVCFFFLLLHLRFFGGDPSMSSGTNGGAPVRFKSGGENAGWVGESEVVGSCRTEGVEGDSRCGFGDTKGDGAPTSGGTTAAGNSYHSVQKDKNSSTSHLYRVSNTRTYLNVMTVASWACRSGFSLEIPRCRPTLQGEIARSPPQVARLQQALQALRCVLVPPGLRVGAPSCASSSSSSFSDSSSSSRRSSPPRFPVAELLPLQCP